MMCRGHGSSAAGQPGSRVHGIHLRAPYRLRSADDLQYPFSNYVRGYNGLLDYILYEPDQLEVRVSPTLCMSAPTAFSTTTLRPCRLLWHVLLPGQAIMSCGGAMWLVCALGACCCLVSAVD